MFENALALRKVSFGKKIAAKTAVSLLVIALAVALPQIVHIALGQPGGVKWLPMYLPVLIGGCLLGPVWGAGVGILSPAVSSLITSAFGNAMPPAVRLPFMMAELFVFGLVSGLSSKMIARHPLMAFPAVILAQIAGRGVFLGLVAIFGNMTVLKVPMIWNQIIAGIPGIVVQAVAVPLIVIALRALMLRGERE